MGVDDIGQKILPGIIPMLVQGSLSKHQFSEIMTSIKRMLDEIEKTKMPTLKDEVSTKSALDAFNTP